MIILVVSMQIQAKIDQRHFPKRHRTWRSWKQTHHVKDGEAKEGREVSITPWRRRQTLLAEPGLGLEPSSPHSEIRAHITPSKLIMGLTFYLPNLLIGKRAGGI